MNEELLLTVTTKGQVMDDNAVSNIIQILRSFDNFVIVVENPVWIKTAKAEDIKNGFKLGSFIEKSLSNFRSRNLASDFFIVLNQWWKTKKHRTKIYGEDFFQFACDRLLAKFFMYEDILEASLEIAVRVYTSIFPKRRLKKCISDLILTSSSQKSMSDFTIANITDNIELKKLEYSLILSNWCNALQTGREIDVRKEVENKLSLYKIESSLHLLIGILSLSTVTDSEKHIQNIVLENLLQKMLDRCLLSKSFWLTMFKKVDLLYILYIGSMMKHEDGLWQSDENVSLCPEITYQEILGFIKNIYDISCSSKHFVNQKLKEAQDNTNSYIWKYIKQDL
ncbi:uncharacterized protein LOC108912598 [Anoplophora glabripennis]|uniref:uncharacterized protein LOC108912598 n=1 Tax=Anoplophora glabripennis TaxID=217634 RepID=UPI000873E852|nr:uncharacterized protein LOC108912598 [Anoplophora glabripennis]